MKRFLASLTILTICMMAFGFVAGSSLTGTAYAKPPTPFLSCPYGGCTQAGSCNGYVACWVAPNVPGHRHATWDGSCNQTPDCCGILTYLGPCH